MFGREATTVRHWPGQSPTRCRCWSRRSLWLGGAVAIVVLLIAGCAAPRAASDPAILAASDVQLEPLPSDDAAPRTETTSARRLPPTAISDVRLAALHDDDGPEPLEVLPVPPDPNEYDFPIDLPTALRLAGANNLNIALAAERVEEAYAQVAAAKAAWVPSLNGGVVYNKHDGRIQATPGEVIEASRGSLYVGGGLGTGRAPLNGGSGGPARMFVDLSLAKVLFEPLAARQHADAAGSSEIAVFNDTLLKAVLAYLDLVRTQTRAGILADTVQHAERLSKITDDFARAGEGYRADAERAAADLARWRRELLRGQEETKVAAARLAGILRLDPTTKLFATDQQALPLDMVEADQPLGELICQAIAARPEVSGQEALLAETATRSKQEHWRPWLPHLYAGFSAGGFGGNDDSTIKNFSDRTDFDLAAVWQMENLGLGNRALQRREDSRHRQAHLAAELTRDVVSEEVTRAYHEVRSREQQIEAVRVQVTAAERALELNFDGIRGAVLRPIEAQQAIGALVDARLNELDAVLDYNASQFALLRAIGLPPHATVEP